jgi:hypothetical protein
MQNCRLEKSFLIDVVSKIYVATDSSPVDMQTYELCSDMIDVVIDVSCIYGMKEDSDGLAYDEKSQSLIKLSNGMVLYLREVNKYAPHHAHASPHAQVPPVAATHRTGLLFATSSDIWPSCASCGRRTLISTVRPPPQPQPLLLLRSRSLHLQKSPPRCRPRVTIGACV